MTSILIVIALLIGGVLGMGYATYRIAKALLFRSGRLAKKVISKF